MIRWLSRLHGMHYVFLVIVGAITLIATLFLALEQLGFTPTPEWCTDRWLAKCTEHRPLKDCRVDQRALGCKEE